MLKRRTDLRADISFIVRNFSLNLAELIRARINR